MIQRTLAHLAHADRALLAESTVQGQQFDSAIMAEALCIPVSHLEDRLVSLAQAGQIIAKVAERDLPDGTLSAARKAVLSGRVADAFWVIIPMLSVWPRGSRFCWKWLATRREP